MDVQNTLNEVSPNSSQLFPDKRSGLQEHPAFQRENIPERKCQPKFKFQVNGTKDTCVTGKASSKAFGFSWRSLESQHVCARPAPCAPCVALPGRASREGVKAQLSLRRKLLAQY